MQTCDTPMSPKKRGSVLPSHCEVRRFTDENITCSFPFVFNGPAALLKGKLRFVHSQRVPTQLRKMTRFLITLLFYKGKKNLQGLLHSALSNFILPSLNAERSKAVSESSSLITFHFRCSQNTVTICPNCCFTSDRFKLEETNCDF